MDRILVQIQELTLDDMFTAIADSTRILSRTEMTILIVLAAAGALFCLFGLKIVRFWAAVLGLGFGLSAGTLGAYLIGADTSYIWIPGAVIGIIIAVLGARFYRFGVFLTVWISVTSLCTYIVRPSDWVPAAVCIGAGLIFALITIKSAVFITMLATALCGAALSGTALCYLLPVRSTLIHVAVCAVLAVIGLLVQLLFESRKKKKQNLRKADEIRKAESTENEVEKARAFVEEIDKEETDETEFLGEDLFEEGSPDEEEDSDIEYLDDDDEESEYSDDDDEEEYLDDDDDIEYFDIDEIKK